MQLSTVMGLSEDTMILFILQDDIGDKSVFIFNALPQEEKAALIERLEEQNNPQNLN